MVIGAHHGGAKLIQQCLDHHAVDRVVFNHQHLSRKCGAGHPRWRDEWRGIQAGMSQKNYS